MGYTIKQTITLNCKRETIESNVFMTLYTIRLFCFFFRGFKYLEQTKNQRKRWCADANNGQWFKFYHDQKKELKKRLMNNLIATMCTLREYLKVHHSLSKLLSFVCTKYAIIIHAKVNGFFWGDDF